MIKSHLKEVKDLLIYHNKILK